MGIMVVLLACAIAFGLLYFFIWINAVRHAVQNENLESWEKVAWIFGMICFPFFGLVFYWIISGNNAQMVPQKAYRESDLV